MDTLFAYAPTSYGWRELLTDGAVTEGPTGLQMVGAGIMAFWMGLVFLMMIGFAYSYFWTASTIIYFLLCKEVDDTDLDEVYMEEEDEEAFTIPAAPVTQPAEPPDSATVPMATTAPPAEPAPEAPSEPSSDNPSDGEQPPPAST